jgi:predicted MFS family arabinose efflux permease
MPFLMIVSASLVGGIVIATKLRPIEGHLRDPARVDRRALHHLAETVVNPRYIKAFLATAMLSIGGFMLMPFGSAYTVHNLEIPIERLPMIYLFTGFCAIFVGPLVGKVSDSLGKFNVFLFGTALSIVMVLIYTHLGPSTLATVMAVNAILFVGIFSRMIPSQALMSAIPTPQSRGSFMAVSSSIQQVAGGVASILAGLIVVEGPGGVLQHFDVIGYVVAGATLVTLALMYLIHKQVPESPAAREPAPAGH